MRSLKSCLLGLMILCLPPAALAQTADVEAGIAPPPTSLQQRLAEYQEFQARRAAQRAQVQQSRLRRLTGSGRAAGPVPATAPEMAPSALEGRAGSLVARRTARVAAAAFAAAVAVAAVSGDASSLAVVSGATDAAALSQASPGITTTATSSSSGTN